MKNFILLGAVLCGASGFALPMALTSIVLTKDSTVANFHYLANRNVPEWCSSYAHSVQLGSFQAAKEFEALPDGLYTCIGQYAVMPGQGGLQIFSLGTCRVEDPSQLRKSCP